MTPAMRSISTGASRRRSPTRLELPFEDRGSGLYRIEWRGLSGDGHAMRRTFAFRVR